MKGEDGIMMIKKRIIISKALDDVIKYYSHRENVRLTADHIKEMRKVKEISPGVNLWYQKV